MMRYRIKKRLTSNGPIYWAEVKGGWFYAWQSFAQRRSRKEAHDDILKHQQETPHGDEIVWESDKNGGIL